MPCSTFSWYLCEIRVGNFEYPELNGLVFLHRSSIRVWHCDAYRLGELLFYTHTIIFNYQCLFLENIPSRRNLISKVWHSYAFQNFAICYWLPMTMFLIYGARPCKTMIAYLNRSFIFVFGSRPPTPYPFLSPQYSIPNAVT